MKFETFEKNFISIFSLVAFVTILLIFITKMAYPMLIILIFIIVVSIVINRKYIKSKKEFVNMIRKY